MGDIGSPKTSLKTTNFRSLISQKSEGLGTTVSCNLDVRGSVHHSTIHKENPTSCNSVSKFYYSIFIWSSTCFGRHSAQHQEPKTVLAVSCFSYVVGCWTCGWWTLSGTVWASYKYGIITFLIHCCILLDFFMNWVSCILALSLISGWKENRF